MAYIGNNIQTQGFTPAVDYFSGNGSTVTFTLSRPVAAAVQVEAVIDNVIQNPSSAYTVSGNAITFTSAPLSGTNNIWVEYTSLITTYAAISQSPSVIGDITASGGYLAVGSFGNSFIDGTVVDYTTGNGRLTVGAADGFTIYNGGTTARNALMTLDSSGNMGVGTTSPGQKLEVNGNVLLAANQNLYFNNASGFSPRLSNSASNDALSVFTGNVERVRVDSSGRVTMPYQPAFCVGISGAVSSAGVMIFNVTSGTGGAAIFFNRGGYYSTSNGRFTAPVAGAYQFNFMALLVGGSTAWVEVNTLLNGTISQQTRRETTGADDNTVNLHTVVYMNANDYLQISIAGFSSGATFQANDTRIFNSFSGSLLG